MSDIKIKNQKIIKVGNSYAVTLDKEFVDRSVLRVGESLIAHYDAFGSQVSFTKPDSLAGQKKNGRLNYAEKTAVMASKVTPEFQKWVENTLKEDKEALEELANL